MTTDQPLMIVIDSGLKSAILCAGGLLVAQGLMRHSSAARRHVVHIGILIACLLLPVLSLLLPHWRVLPQWPTPAAQVVPPPAAVVATVAQPAALAPTPLPPAIVMPSQPAPIAATPRPFTARPIQPAWYTQFTLAQWLTFAWFAGATLFLLPILLGQLAIFRIRSSARPINGAFISSRCRMPMACGLLHPVIILPEDAHTWPAARRDAVIRHENEHLRRYDCLWQQLGQFARALYWFNPLIWLTHHRMLCEAERACDDAVLTEGSKPSDYAEHLLAIATTGRSDLLLASAGVAMARTTSLEGRLLSILDAARSRHGVTRGLVCLCIVVVLGVAAPLAMLRAQSPILPAPATQPATTRPAADLASSTLNPVDMLMEKADALAQAEALQKEADLKRKEGKVAEAAIAERQRDAAQAEVALWDTRIKQAATRPASSPIRVIIGSADLLLINGKPGHWSDLQDFLSHLQGPSTYYLERAVADSKMPLDTFQQADERLKAMVRQCGLKYFSDTGMASDQEIATYKKAVAERPAATAAAAPKTLVAAPAEAKTAQPVHLDLRVQQAPREYPIVSVEPGAEPEFAWDLPAQTKIDYMAFLVSPIPRSDVKSLLQQQLWRAMNDINQMSWFVLGMPGDTQHVQYGVTPRADGPMTIGPVKELREGFYLVILSGYQGRFNPQEGRQPFASATCVLKVGNPKEPPKPDYSKLTPEQMQAKVQEWVEDFFSSNYRDITARKLIEWGKAQKLDNGNWQIRYKYEATIWNKDKVIHDKLFTFTSEGGFVSVSDASPSQPAPAQSARPAQPAKPVTPADRTKADELAKEGWNLWQKQQFAPAADRFSEAVKLNPNATNALNGLGWALFNSGRSDEAHAAFAKCIALAPNHPAALNGLGQIELQQGDLAQSEKHLLAAAPTSSAAWWGLAKLYLVQEKYADAAKWADRILKDDPSNAEAKQLKTAAQEKRLPDVLRELKAKDQEQGKTSSVQPAAPAANTADAGLPPLARRDVNRPLSDFPQKVDLSTPESAWAAWQRASSRMDAQAVVDLSWVAIPLEDEKAFWERELARNPENVKIFTQALANSKLLEVFLDRDELATTITHLAYPEGKGRDPYSIRVFGKIAGQWKNLGEDRSATLEEARTLPQIKRSGYWNQFQDLKAVWEKRLSNTMATASSTTAFEHVIPFELGKTSFLEGDRIVIKEIRGAAPTITPGNTYLITGTYTLSSRERATIGAFTTAADPHEGKGPIAKAQMVSVNKGDGTFTLTMPITIKGQTHLSFYPAEGGGSFGEVYFNTP